MFVNSRNFQSFHHFICRSTLSQKGLIVRRILKKINLWQFKFSRKWRKLITFFFWQTTKKKLVETRSFKLFEINDVNIFRSAYIKCSFLESNYIKKKETTKIRDTLEIHQSLIKYILMILKITDVQYVQKSGITSLNFRNTGVRVRRVRKKMIGYKFLARWNRTQSLPFWNRIGYICATIAWLHHSNIYHLYAIIFPWCFTEIGHKMV